MFGFLRDLRKSNEEKCQELLTAYIDDKLTSKDRRSFEHLLEADVSLRADLEQQQSIKESLRQLPQIRAPRSFTLDPALYGRPQPQPRLQFYPALRAATVLAAFVFVALISVDLFLEDSGLSSNLAAPDETSALSQLATEKAADGFAEELAEAAVEGRAVAEEAPAMAIPAEEPQIEEIEEVVAEEVILEAEGLEPPDQPAEEAVAVEAAVAEEATAAAEGPVSEDDEERQFMLPQIEAGEGSDALQGTIAAGAPPAPSTTAEAPQAEPEIVTDDASADDEVKVGEAISETLLISPDPLETEESIPSTEKSVADSESILGELSLDSAIDELLGAEDRPLEEYALVVQESESRLSPLNLLEIFLGILVVILVIATLVTRRRASSW
jgi:anti-sigma factor RsiW